MTKVTEFLVKAKAVIDTPEKWTKGYLARDIHGLPVSPVVEEATCFCSLGALDKAESEYLKQPDTGAEIYDLTVLASDALRSAVHERTAFNSVARFNDLEAVTHDKLMGLWDRAIEISKSTRYG